MLDYDVFAIVGVARNEINVDNLPIGNGAHFVQRLAVCIAMHGPNINSFMEAGVNDPFSSAFRVADKSVLATFPWRRLHAVVVSFNILVKSGAISRKKSVVVRWQDKIEDLILCWLNYHRRRGKET